MDIARTLDESGRGRLAFAGPVSSDPIGSVGIGAPVIAGLLNERSLVPFRFALPRLTPHPRPESPPPPFPRPLNPSPLMRATDWTRRDSTDRPTGRPTRRDRSDRSCQMRHRRFNGWPSKGGSGSPATKGCLACFAPAKTRLNYLIFCYWQPENIITRSCVSHSRSLSLSLSHSLARRCMRASRKRRECARLVHSAIGIGCSNN